MVDSEKVKILLADEDALRRDGIAAVLRGTAQFEIVAQCPDGEAAMEQIRQLRPDVAVVDLNLPKLHGIELIRRVRGEALGAKIVIVSGTSDDEIVREVVRAGGDAYLLKNGPARHLIDAISYVRDGGQYFSPQLGRNGRERHLLEETPRVADERPARAPQTIPDEDEEEPAIEDEPATERRGARDTRSYRARRTASRGGARRSGESERLRERLRENAGGDNLDERDYEILSMMADGIRPILDRLDEIENRVGDMESGESPVPSNVRNWLNTQMADTFRDPRSAARDVSLERTVSDLEVRLPQMIEEAVTTRFHNMAAKLQKDIEETHIRTLETFVKNIQVKLVQRVSALETDMSKQAEAMNQLREYSQRTEDNLSRLISGVDKLAQELPKRLQAPIAEAQPPALPEARPARRKAGRSMKLILIWVGIAVAVAAVFWGIRLLNRRIGPTDYPAPTTSAAPAPPKLQPPPASADAKTKIQAAQQYADRKEYAAAEDIYKQVLKAEPNNVDAIKGLADVLYREDKIDESAAVLDKLPRN